MTGSSLSMIVDGSFVIFTGSYFYKIRREWWNAREGKTVGKTRPFIGLQSSEKD
jgi:hypothetical protein